MLTSETFYGNWTTKFPNNCFAVKTRTLRMSQGLTYPQEIPESVRLFGRLSRKAPLRERCVRRSFSFSPFSSQPMGSALFALLPSVIRAPVRGRAYPGTPTLFHAGIYKVLRELEREVPKTLRE